MKTLNLILLAVVAFAMIVEAWLSVAGKTSFTTPNLRASCA